jgi:uncharacterized membrane protein
MMVPFPALCFIGALITDVAYWATANMQWANFSAWLLVAGAFLTGLAVLAGLIAFFANAWLRRSWLVEVWLFGNVLALAVSILDCFVHSRDAYTSVVPAGLFLTALQVAILLVTGWRSWALIRVYPAGTEPEVRP